MRNRLYGAIGLVAAVGGGLSLFLVLTQLDAPDTSTCVPGGLWLTAPYLTAVLFAGLFRRYQGAMITLLVSLFIASVVGVWFYYTSADAHAESRRQVETAVLPGEDPHSGPAGMRKSGADLGATISDVFSILIAVVIPPVQFFGIVIPTLIGFACSKRVGPADRRDTSVTE